MGLRRDEAELGIAHDSSPRALIGQTIGDGPRFELFVCVDEAVGRAGGMRAALPSVDRFLPGYDVASLEDLGTVLGGIERRRAA